MFRLLSWVGTVVLATGCGRIGIDDRTGQADAPAGADAPARTDAPTTSDAAAADAAVDATPTCPAGTTAITTGAQICVEQAERGNLPWDVARDTCLALGRRLCADAEWALACADATGLVDMANDGGGATPEWEWVAEESAGVAQKRGYSACADTSSHAIVDPYDFRCCLDL